MLEIFESNFWVVSHRADSRYSGHLIVASKGASTQLSELEPASLSEMSVMLARTEKLLNLYSNPHRIVMARLGFTKEYSIHFHILPVHESLLDEIIEHPDYCNDPDGNDALLFACREYCERPLTPEEEMLQKKTVNALRLLVDQID